MQKAASANPNDLPSSIDPFHMNMPSNGWPVHHSRHTSNHSNYSNEILQHMNNWSVSNPNATPAEAATVLANWQIALKEVIGNGVSTPNINTLTLPVIP